LVFPFFPVGRAKFLSKRNLDAAHISPGEICGLTSDNKRRGRRFYFSEPLERTLHQFLSLPFPSEARADGLIPSDGNRSVALTYTNVPLAADFWFGQGAWAFALGLSPSRQVGTPVRLCSLEKKGRDARAP
jgi:hypothetical protein